MAPYLPAPLKKQLKVMKISLVNVEVQAGEIGLKIQIVYRELKMRRVRRLWRVLRSFSKSQSSVYLFTPLGDVRTSTSLHGIGWTVCWWVLIRSFTEQIGFPETPGTTASGDDGLGMNVNGNGNGNGNGMADENKAYVEQIKSMKEFELTTLYVDFGHLLEREEVLARAIQSQYYRFDLLSLDNRDD
jgi:hypothetical protein